MHKFNTIFSVYCECLNVCAHSYSFARSKMYRLLSLERHKPFSKANSRKKTTSSISFFFSVIRIVGTFSSWAWKFNFFLFYLTSVDQHLFVFFWVKFYMLHEWNFICVAFLHSIEIVICLSSIFEFVGGTFFPWFTMTLYFQFDWICRTHIKMRCFQFCIPWAMACQMERNI